MTNQAAQTMPELPEPWTIRYHDDATGREIGPPTPLYTADQMHQYARDYAAALSQTAGVPEGWKLVPVEPTDAMMEAAMQREDDEPLSSWGKIVPAPHEAIYCAMLAAAPSASGGDVWTREMVADVHRRGEELYRRIHGANPPPAASVSERARALLAAEYRAAGFNAAADWIAEADMDAEENDLDRCVIRALEQALTQQRVAEWSDDLRAVLDAASEASQVPLMWLANQDFSPEQTKAWLCEAVDATVEEGAFSGSLHQVAEEGTGHVVAFTGCGPKSAANAKFLIWCVHFILKHRDALATTPQPSADAVRELVLLSRGLAKRTFNRSTAEMYIHFADKLESLLSGGFHA